MPNNNGVTAVKRDNLLPVLHTEAGERVVSPATDVYETPAAFVLLLEMSGVAKDAIHIKLEGGVLSAKARIVARHKGNAMLLLNELQSATYYRVFNVGDNIDRSGVDVAYEHGVLMIKLLKREEARPREIEIKEL